MQPEHAQEVLDLHAAMDQAIEAGHALPGKVHRGLDATPALIKALKTGEFTNAGFMSTSIDPITAAEFAQGNRMVMTIHQKTGLPLEAVTAVTGEKEVLLRNLTRFRVDSIKKVTASQHWTGQATWDVQLTEL